MVFPEHIYPVTLIFWPKPAIGCKKRNQTIRQVDQLPDTVRHEYFSLIRQKYERMVFIEYQS